MSKKIRLLKALFMEGKLEKIDAIIEVSDAFATELIVRSAAIECSEASPLAVQGDSETSKEAVDTSSSQEEPLKLKRGK